MGIHEGAGDFRVFTFCGIPRLRRGNLVFVIKPCLLYKKSRVVGGGRAVVGWKEGREREGSDRRMPAVSEAEVGLAFLPGAESELLQRFCHSSQLHSSAHSISQRCCLHPTAGRHEIHVDNDEVAGRFLFD